MKKILLFSFFVMTLAFQANAQRYITEIFDNVTVSEDVVYGGNATLLYLSLYNQAIQVPLKMDIYQPEGDSLTDRPLVIIFHTGNFLPPVIQGNAINGGCTGTKKDGDIVETAMRLAKMGYVVASADYRLGWDPTNDAQIIRKATLINAAYRGIQDSRTCIRYFRKTIAEASNPYGVDESKIVLWGVGTGGYISLGSATLDSVEDTWISKFFINTTTPMVIESINGNPDGTVVGIVPADYPGLPEGDTLNYPNHETYSSDFNLAVNIGGALADTSFIDANDVPVISFHVPTDPYAPCGEGLVVLPPPLSLPIVTVQGSCLLQTVFEEKGVNSCLTDGSLRLFDTDSVSIASPWYFSTSSNPYGANVDLGCPTDSESAGLYLDTIINYFAPRALGCLGLPTATKDIVTAQEIGLVITPNPSNDVINFTANADTKILDIYVYDLAGQLITIQNNVNTNSFTLQRNNIPSGIYFVKMRLDSHKLVTSKIVFE